MVQDSNELLKRVTIIPGLMNGKPTIRGMRFPVADVLQMLYHGMTETEILEQHPILEQEDIKAALLFAAHSVENVAHLNAAA